MKTNYTATAIFSRIISLIISDGVLWVDSDVTRSQVAETSSKIMMFPLCFMKKPLLPSPVTLGGSLANLSARILASSSVIFGILSLSISWKQMSITFSTPHCVKYVNTLLINIIIYYFQQFATVIKPQKQVFISKFIQNVIINGIFYGFPNRYLCYTMVKGGGVKFNSNIHTLEYNSLKYKRQGESRNK